MLGIRKDSTEPLIYNYNKKNTSTKLSMVLKSKLDKPFVILCIGTDRCIGDCLGPLVGFNLKKLGASYPVYGTISDPVHAVNLSKNLEYISHKYINHKIIAIDASLGSSKSIGTIQFREGPIFPGKGVGKKLPPVGDYSLIGVVDSVDIFNNSNIHQVRLNLVMEMANVITESIYLATQYISEVN